MRTTSGNRFLHAVFLITVCRNGYPALDAAIEASSLLFGKSTKEGLEKLDEQTFLDVFDGVPQFEIGKDQLGQPAIELFTTVETLEKENPW